MDMVKARAPHAAPASSLRPLIAIVMDTAVSFDREIVAGAAQYAREAGDWRLYVEEEPRLRLPNLQSWHGQGILASFNDPAIVEPIIAAGVPVVAVGGIAAHDPASGIPLVATDDAAIAALAAEHFIDRGLRNFGYYGRLPSSTARWSERRGDAFIQRLAAAGFGCQRHTASQGPNDWAGLQGTLGDWLAALPKPAGVMACDDSCARHVLEACQARGIRVPHDVSVVGVDDDELVCELAVPPLTSIRQATRRIGHEAARLLDRLIRGGPDVVVPLETRIPPVGIVARTSSETLAVADPEVARVIETIRTRACGNLDIEELAAVYGLPRWKLEKRFRECVGHSIHDDIARVRLAEAERLLRGTGLPLKAIAPRAGFRSVPYMITVFRRRHGITPARFRKLERGRDIVTADDEQTGSSP